MAPAHSPLTQQLVEYQFAPGEQADAARRLSLGYPDDLQEAIRLAQRDWRDVLVWAGCR